MHSNTITIYSTALNSIHATYYRCTRYQFTMKYSSYYVRIKVYNGSMKSSKLCLIVTIHSVLFALLHDFTPPNMLYFIGISVSIVQPMCVYLY